MSTVVLTSSHGDDAIFLVKQFLVIIEHDRLIVAVEQERNSLSLEICHTCVSLSLLLAKHVQKLNK